MTTVTGMPWHSEFRLNPSIRYDYGSAGSYRSDEQQHFLLRDMLISNLNQLSSRGCFRSNNGIRRSWIMPQLRFTVDWLSACAEARAVCLRLPSKNAHTLDHPHRNCKIKYIQVNIYLKLKCWISTQSKVMTSSGNKLEIRKIVVLLQPAVCRPTIYWTIWAMWIKTFPFSQLNSPHNNN